jgi:suppressor for copper-sensitivity B
MIAKMAGPARHLFGIFSAVVTLSAISADSVDAAVGASEWTRTRMADIRLVSAASGTGDGTTVPLGLQFKLAEGWKIYWRTPGDAGFPPDLEIKSSENLRDLEWQWPVPHRFSLFGQESHGYKDEVVFPITARLAEPGMPLEVDAVVHALACSEICVPLDAAISFALPAGPGGPTVFTQLVSRYRSLVPGPLDGTGLSVVAVDPIGSPKPHSLKVTISSDIPLVGPDVFVEAGDGYTFGKPSVALAADGRAAELTLPASQPKGGSLAARPVTLTLVDGDRFIEIKKIVGAAPNIERSVGLDVPLATWLTMLGLGLLGGFILNFMPCVLPVLSLKLLGVLRHGGGDVRHIRRGFIASALGIIACFMTLAAGALALKQAGLAVGWGIQFQQPLFLALMIVLLTGFAANLFGWLEISLPNAIARLGTLGPIGGTYGPRSGGARDLFGHFLTGAFAALLATPCSAPFLGTALGFALARGPVEIIAIFLTLGVGLALPYLLVAIRPALVRGLPRPGRWMEHLKVVLGFALVATAVWLFTVAAAQIQITGLSIMAALLIAAGVILALTRSRASRLIAGLFAVGVLIVGGLAEKRSGGPADGFATIIGLPGTKINWVAFDPTKLGELVHDGQVVFVDVTADWCLTCKVNKALVLDQDPVASRLVGEGIVAMRADWTKPNAQIAAYLASFQRYGIPFNAVYGPAALKGVALPELLTTDAVLQALDKAGEVGKGTKRTASVIPDPTGSQ